MRRPLAGEGGAALLMTVAFMALAIPLITGALGLASTLSIDSRVKTRILKSQYAAIGGSQHALYRLLNEPDIIQKIATADSYTLTIDGNPVTVTILKRSSPPDDPLPASSHSGRKLQTVKTVSPATGSVNTTFKYTITVSNRHDRAIKITKIHDDLPRCFTYASGSTRGITTGDPIATGDPCVSGSAPYVGPPNRSTSRQVRVPQLRR